MAGDTFDAGTVYAEARLGRDEFQRDLDQLRKDMAAFERGQYRVQVGVNDAPLDSGVKGAEAKLGKLGKTRTQPTVGLNHRPFLSRMFDVRRNLEQVARIVATPQIIVEIGKSIVKIAALKYELADLAQQSIIDVVIYPQIFQEINRISDSLLSMRNVARVAIPSMLPLFGAVSGGALIAASSIAGAGSAVGIFALGAIPLLTGVVEKSKEIEDAQKAVTEAITDEQRHTALHNLEIALAAVSESERQAVTDIGLIKEAWRGFQTSIQPAVFGVLNNSVSLISKLLPALVPVIEAVAVVLNGWIDSLEAGVDSGGLKKFTDWLVGPGVQNLDMWGRALGNFVTGFTNLLMGTTQPSLAFTESLLRMSTEFRSWSETLATNQQFQEWLRFTQAVMPDVLSILGQLLPILWQIHSIFAPITEAVLGFVAGFMEAHPTLTRFLIVGFVVSQFFIGLVGIIAGLILKVLLFAAIFGRIAAVMAIGRTASLLWAAVMTGNLVAVRALLMSLIVQIWRLSAIGRIFTFITGLTNLWAAAQWVLNSAFLASPITWIVAALIALGAALYLAWTYSETFRNFVTSAWEAIGRTAQGVWEDSIKPAIDWIVAAWHTLVAAAQAAGQWIVEAWNNVIWFFQSLPGWARDALVWLGQVIADGATAAWNWLVDAAITAGNATIDFIQKLPGRIAYGLGFLAGFLVKAAIDGWNGFTNGIVTAWNATAEWLVALPGRFVTFMNDLEATLRQAATDGWNGFTQGLTDAWVATLAWLDGIQVAVTTALQDFGAWVAKIAVDGWNGFTQGLVDGWNATVEWLVGTPQRVSDGIGDLGEGLGSAAETGWAGFTSGLQRGWDATVAWFLGLPAAIAGFFVTADQWLSDAGHFIWDGLVAGLTAGWNAVWEFFAGLIDDFIQGFKDAMGIASPSTLFAQFGQWIMEGLLNGLRAFGQMILDFILGFGQSIGDGFMAATSFVGGLWNNFWDGLATVTQSMFDTINNIVQMALDWVQNTFGVNMDNLRAGWDQFWNTLRAITETVFNLIKFVIETAWQVVKLLFQAAIALLTGNWDLFWNTLRQIAATVWGAIQIVIQTVWAIIQTVFRTAIDFLVGVWNNFWNGLRVVTETVFNGIKGTIDRVIAGIVSAFEFVVSKIGQVWNGIRSLLAKPINFMINTVYNGGIVKAWNFVAGLLGIPGIGTIAPIPEFAKGGPVRGDQIIRAGEKGDEYVLSAPAVRGLGGLSAVERLHRKAVRDPLSLRDLNSGRMVEGADHDGPGISRSGFGGVKPHVAAAGHYLKNRFGIASVGGVGQRANASDHPKGLALDFMTYNNQAKGDALVNHMLPNAGHYAIKYIIWKQRINSGNGWKGMADRGSPTANHFDHPHVSFLAGPGGGGAFDGSGGFFVELLIDQVRKLYDGATAGIPGAIAGLVGPPPPRFREIPPAMARTAIKSVGDFLFGKANDIDAGKTVVGPTPKSFDSGGLIQPGWNSIWNGTGQPELAGRVDQWATLINSARVSMPSDESVAGQVSAGLIRQLMEEIRDQAPLVGSMHNELSDKVSSTDVADEVVRRIKSVKRGGVHGGRPH